MASPVLATKHDSVSMRGLKEFVEKSVPHDTPLYKVVVAEKDELSPEEYASKSEVWLRLIDISFPVQG
ncbi:MAG: hypothetical protein ABSB29_09870 [Nitrososphaerales archaeon]|jgi:hypothetical protein